MTGDDVSRAIMPKRGVRLSASRARMFGSEFAVVIVFHPGWMQGVHERTQKPYQGAL